MRLALTIGGRRGSDSVTQVKKSPTFIVPYHGEFHSGSNFDTAERGKKDALFTDGLNGVGVKGMGAFGKRFVAVVQNAADGKEATFCATDHMAVVAPVRLKALR